MAVKYFETGYLALDDDMVLKLTDISLNYTNDLDEVHTFDESYNKAFEYAYGSWTVSANGVLTDDTTVPDKMSGETPSTGTNGLLLLEEAKGRAKGVMVLKIDTNNYQTGTVLFADYSTAGAIGTKMTYSISLQGSGALTKASSHA